MTVVDRDERGLLWVGELPRLAREAAELGNSWAAGQRVCVVSRKVHGRKLCVVTVLSSAVLLANELRAELGPRNDSLTLFSWTERRSLEAPGLTLQELIYDYICCLACCKSSAGQRGRALASLAFVFQRCSASHHNNASL